VGGASQPCAGWTGRRLVGLERGGAVRRRGGAAARRRGGAAARRRGGAAAAQARLHLGWRRDF